MNKNSDWENFEKLFRRYYKPLRSYAFRFLNDKDLSEDITQDVFFELWSHRNDLSLDDSLKSYLFKSVYNRSINVLNSYSARHSTSLETISDQEFLHHIMKTQNQENSLLLKELESEIQAFMETLPDQCRKIFILSRTQGLKNKEIAEKLGISIKAVEKQITKALSELRIYLRERDLLFLLFLLRIF